MTNHRPPAVAGTFYPRSAQALSAEVDRLLDEATPRSSAEGPRLGAKVFIVPHAGYVYSGPIAASAFARIRSDIAQTRRVVLLGPSHYVPFVGLAVPTVHAFDTPLGVVPLDAVGRARALELPQVRQDDLAHAREHSLEVQLPFLQRALRPGFTLLPFSVGRCRPAEVAQVLEHVVGGDDQTLVLISSDLSHYLPYEEAKKVDRKTADHVLQLEVVSAETACGAAPVNGVIEWARQRQLRPRLLDLRNSGDTAGGRDEVVGYGAFAFLPEDGR